MYKAKEKLYISATYGERHKYRDFYNLLDESDIFEPVGFWLWTEEGTPTAEYAARDFTEVCLSDRLICLNENKYNSGGKCAEFGMALALKKTIDLIGPKTQIFHYMSGVNHYTDLNEWIAKNL